METGPLQNTPVMAHKRGLLMAWPGYHLPSTGIQLSLRETLKVPLGTSNIAVGMEWIMGTNIDALLCVARVVYMLCTT